MLKKMVILAAALCVPAVVSATTVYWGDYFLKGAERAEEDVYVVGRSATLVGVAEQDVVLISEKIFSESDITGDALLVGQDVSLHGTIADDVRVLGNTVSIGGSVKGDVVVIGAKILLQEGSRVEGSLLLLGGDIEIRGTVLGGAKVLSGTLLLTGSIDGDLEAWGKTSFEEPARIGGDFIYHSANKTAAPLNVSIAGKIIPGDVSSGRSGASQPLLGGMFSLKILMMLTLGFALYFLACERTEEVVREALANFWTRALRGFLIILVLSALTLLLVPTVVGIPLALVFGALWILVVLLSWACAGIMVGAWSERFLFRNPSSPLSYRPVLLGSIFLAFSTLIPLVGPLFHGILMVSAAGSVGTLFFRHLRGTR